ncbi:MAG: hypothetical protein ACFFCT_12095, partial [Candidatus Odinarchaeota archaeon]
MSLYNHETTCPDCEHFPANLAVDTSAREVWVECDNCGLGLYDEDILKDHGYSDPESRQALHHGISGLTYLPWEADLEEKIKILEFFRACASSECEAGEAVSFKHTTVAVVHNGWCPSSHEDLAEYLTVGFGIYKCPECNSECNWENFHPESITRDFTCSNEFCGYKGRELFAYIGYEER